MPVVSLANALNATPSDIAELSAAIGKRHGLATIKAPLFTAHQAKAAIGEADDVDDEIDEMLVRIGERIGRERASHLYTQLRATIIAGIAATIAQTAEGEGFDAPA